MISPTCERRALLTGAPCEPPDGTFADALAAAARAAGEEPFLHRVGGRGVGEVWSFGEVHARVERLAGALFERGARPGDVIAVASPDPLELAASVLAVLRLGATVLPCPTPPRPDAVDPWLASLQPALSAARTWGLVAPEETAEAVAAGAGRYGLSLKPVAAAGASPCVADPVPEGRLPEPHADAPALLQFLSGSLREPSSPVLTQRNLIANVHAMGLALELTDEDRLVSWLPLYTDMGLVGVVLLALVWRLPVWLMRPESFLVRPATWLRTISEVGGTISAAPDFGYRLATTRVRDRELAGCDLSRWRIALSGSEPVLPSTNRAFGERFAGYGFDSTAITPAYGLAHAGLAVTIGTPGTHWQLSPPDPDPWDRRPSLGGPIPGHQVGVVRADGTFVTPGEVGEVVIQGPSIPESLLGSPEVLGPTLRDGWLWTGDLGFVSGGELVLTGRRKRLVIKRGRNYALEDVEVIVAEAAELSRHAVAAFVVPDGESGSESLALSLAAAPDQRDELEVRVQRALLTQLGLKADRITCIGYEPSLSKPQAPVRLVGDAA